MLGYPFEPDRELQQFTARAGAATLVGQFADLRRNFSIMRTIKRWGAGRRPANRKSLLDVWSPHEYHLQKMTLENCEGRPSAKARLRPLSEQREAEQVVESETGDTAEYTLRANRRDHEFRKRVARRGTLPTRSGRHGKPPRL
jgi:hypothetical protein